MAWLSVAVTAFGVFSIAVVIGVIALLWAHRH
jgi:hypothetical protein